MVYRKRGNYLPTPIPDNFSLIYNQLLAEKIENRQLTHCSNLRRSMKYSRSPALHIQLKTKD